MKLCDLQSTPFRAKIITYGSDHNTAVEKRKELQQVSGYLYKGKNLADCYNQAYCRLYVFYEDIGIGMDIGGITRPDERTVEYAISYVGGVENRSPQDFIAYLDAAADAGERIVNAEIALSRYIAPEKADRYAAARQKRIDADNANYAEQRAKQEADDKAFCESRNAEAQQTISAALNIIRTGGTLQNDSISFYRSRYACRSYCIVNHLARQYGIEVPLKVQGWINKKLIEVTIANGRVTSYCHRKGNSGTFCLYMMKLIEAVCHSLRVDEVA